MCVEQLINDLMDHSAEAVQFYCAMAGGDPMVSESFVRDWVAVKLHERRSWTVTVETGRRDVQEHIAGEHGREAHDRLDLKRSYRLDMLLWKDGKPRAIVEFKRNTHLVDDLGRMSGIMSLPALPGNELVGIAVSCCVVSSEAQVDQCRREVEEWTRHVRCGDVRVKAPISLGEGGKVGWLGIFAAQARRPTG